MLDLVNSYMRTLARNFHYPSQKKDPFKKRDFNSMFCYLVFVIPNKN